MKNTTMESFSKPPLSVFTKHIGASATYAEAALWLHSEDSTALQAMRAVREDNCVLFIQLGGTSKVMCVAPSDFSPGGVFTSTRPTRKSRGEKGKALLMLYQ